MGKDSKKYTIPQNGSLGLLALGDIGLIKCIQKKALEAKKKKKSDKKNG